MQYKGNISTTIHDQLFVLSQQGICSFILDFGRNTQNQLNRISNNIPAFYEINISQVPTNLHKNRLSTK